MPADKYGEYQTCWYENLARVHCTAAQLKIVVRRIPNFGIKQITIFRLFQKVFSDQIQILIPKIKKDLLLNKRPYNLIQIGPKTSFELSPLNNLCLLLLFKTIMSKVATKFGQSWVILGAFLPGNKRFERFESLALVFEYFEYFSLPQNLPKDLNLRIPILDTSHRRLEMLALSSCQCMNYGMNGMITLDEIGD
jgi:hypothetical protein